MRMKRRNTKLVSLAATLLLLMACGRAPAASRPVAPAAAKPAAQASPAPAASASKPALTPATLRLDWFPLGYHAPFYLAERDGYYRDQGIDLTIAGGTGSGTVAQAVANGSDTFGLVDAGTMMALVAKGLRVKMVMGVLQKSPNAVVFAADSGIRTPADLRGKQVGFVPGSSAYVLLPAFLATNHLRTAQLKLASTSIQSLDTSLLAHRVAAILTYNFTDIPPIEQRGMRVGSFDYADYGVNVPGLGVVVSDATAAKNGDLVRRFVIATQKGFAAARQDPAAAIDALAAADTGSKIDKALQQQILLQSFKLLATKRTRGHPLGWMSSADWRDAQALLVKYQGIKPLSDINAYFTDKFVQSS